jgi:hypothetical protein
MKTYDAKQVVLTWGGVQLSGFPEGTFIGISKATDNVMRKVGIDGVSRSINNDKTFDVTITLEGTSVSNDYISTIRTLDDATGKGVLPFLMTDLSGSTVFFAESMWVSKDADIDFGNEVSEYAWAFQTGNVDEYNIGGNS